MCARRSATSGGTAPCGTASERRARPRRGRPGRDRHPPHRRVRAARVAHDERLLRGVADGAPGLERLGHQRRVPLRGHLPRPLRARAAGRRPRLLVPHRVRRGVPARARVRGRAPAPERGVHDPRLRRGPARLDRRAPCHQPRGPHHRLALHRAAAARRGHHARRGRRAAGVGRRRDDRGARGGGGRRGRHARDHLRAGVSVLAQAHRAPRAGGVHRVRPERRPARLRSRARLPRRGRAVRFRRLRDRVAAARPAPRHDGAAARPGAVLHEPDRSLRAADHRDRHRHGERVLRRVERDGAPGADRRPGPRAAGDRRHRGAAAPVAGVPRARG